MAAGPEYEERDRLLRLRAEMKLPGEAWLLFQLEPKNGGTRIVQKALFAPRGLAGLAYWYLLYPVHRVIFSGLIRQIARRSTLPPNDVPPRP